MGKVTSLDAPWTISVPKKKKKRAGLNDGEKAGIAIGVIIGVALLAAAVFCSQKKQKTVSNAVKGYQIEQKLENTYSAAPAAYSAPAAPAAYNAPAAPAAYNAPAAPAA